MLCREWRPSALCINGEFDCVIQMKDGYTVIECKHFKEPLTISVAFEEERKIKAIKELEIKGVGFACSSGFDFENTDDWVMLSGENLYSL